MSDGAPWVKFFPSDWLTGTRGMSAAETGVYITLLMMMYEKGGAIPLNASKLARLCGVPAAPFQKILDTLVSTEKVSIDGGMISNSRAKKELAAIKNRSDEAAKAASIRWDKDKENQRPENATASSPQSEQHATRAGDQIPDVRSQKESKPDRSSPIDNPVGSTSPKAKPNRGARLPTDWKLPKKWGDWALTEFPHLTADDVRRMGEDFRDYWVSIPGSKGTKLDWEATWRGSVRRFAPKANGPPAGRRRSNLEIITENLRKEIEDEQRTDGPQGTDRQDDDGLPILRLEHH